jgi:diadenylate cyclase
LNEAEVPRILLLFRVGFLDIGWADIADIALVGLLIYELYKLLRGSVAARIFLGMLIIYALYLLVKAAGMELLTAILDQFIAVGAVAALIVFQPELRRFLLLLGKGTVFSSDFLGRIFSRTETGGQHEGLTAALEAARQLSQSHTGALMVFARSQELRYYVETGEELNAGLSRRLLVSIFFKNSPLHDGAAIISAGKILAARCILPVSERTDLPPYIGLRHRAAVGITELTDSLVLVVSEETGQLAVALEGKLETNLSITEVRARFNRYLLGMAEDK